MANLRIHSRIEDDAQELYGLVTGVISRRGRHAFDFFQGVAVGSDFHENPTISLFVDSNCRSFPGSRIAREALASETGCGIFGSRKASIRVLDTGRILQLGKFRASGAHYFKQRPVCPGVAIAPLGMPNYGTSGMLLKRTACGSSVFITAGHVLPEDFNGRSQPPVMQPFGDSNEKRIGTLIDRSTVLTGPHDKNYVDVAVVRVRGPFRNKIMKKGDEKKKSYLKIRQEAPARPKFGTRIFKSGAASGYSGGYVSERLAAFTVGHSEPGSGMEERATFADQIGISTNLVDFSGLSARSSSAPAGGDSGAMVINEKSRVPVGMIFAGSCGPHGVYFVTPMEFILESMGLEYHIPLDSRQKLNES